jgi:hypothetical protein
MVRIGVGLGYVCLTLYHLEGPVHNIRIWIAKTTLMTNEIKVRNNVTCVWISQAPTNKNATDMEA